MSRPYNILQAEQKVVFHEKQNNRTIKSSIFKLKYV